ncbi:unnamed protein product [Prunus armeniaca]|uniref:Uncharacterized protein n=1 Tax=Prunus armeniaca TaxID=36596 RepID=A0A6J5V624_PRUAR|nr:unnamed protein product [Prunus armeniaca]CAB4314072.1 unnamed protein product [Prunus armeniaca]
MVIDCPEVRPEKSDQQDTIKSNLSVVDLDQASHTETGKGNREVELGAIGCLCKPCVGSSFSLAFPLEAALLQNGLS